MVERRARFNLAKAEKRLHLVQGFLAALTDLDHIVKLIRAADDGEPQAYSFSTLPTGFWDQLAPVVGICVCICAASTLCRLTIL